MTSIVSDLPENIQLNVRLILDDFIMLRKVNSILNIAHLQKDLSNLNSWGNSNKMKMNGMKIK